MAIVNFPGGSMVKISLSMVETEIPSLIWEDSACQGATKPVHHSYWAGVHEPQPLKPMCLRACALQQEKRLQSEACATQWRVASAFSGN